MRVADPSKRLPENVPGEFFVDSSCIDCDTCRALAPAIFRDHGDQSSVGRQPRTAGESRLAMMALVACPTGSIGTTPKRNAARAVAAFPSPIAENVHYCGFTSEASFGAWSYLIVRPESAGGNVLVDSPRYAAPLVRRIAEMGGVRTMFLTHRDDVAEHAKFARRFGCLRVMHEVDGAARLGAERIVRGTEATRLDDDLLVIPTPGHTRGHMVLLYRDRFLFTGDHLSWSPGRGTLTAFRDVTWYSWPEQTRSMEKLLSYDFEWVLPGHGRIHNDTAPAMREHLRACVEWMKTRRDRRAEV